MTRVMAEDRMRPADDYSSRDILAPKPPLKLTKDFLSPVRHHLLSYFRPELNHVS